MKVYTQERLDEMERAN